MTTKQGDNAFIKNILFQACIVFFWGGGGGRDGEGGEGGGHGYLSIYFLQTS